MTTLLIKYRKEDGIDPVPTVIIPAALLQRHGLGPEGLADTILPLGTVVAGPAVSGAVGEVGRRCHRTAPSSGRSSRGRRGKRVRRCWQGQQRRRVRLLGARRGGGVVAVRVLPFQVKLRFEVCSRQKGTLKQIRENMDTYRLFFQQV